MRATVKAAPRTVKKGGTGVTARPATGRRPARGAFRLGKRRPFAKLAGA